MAKIRWTNYHGHSKYCDGHGEIEDYIVRALELGLAAIGLSSHAPVPFPTHWTMPADKVDAYCAEIDQLKEKYKGRIEVFKSLEVDYIPGVTSPVHPSIKRLNLDYTIGSVHFVGQFDNGVYWEIDGPAPDFGKGLDAIYQGDGRKAARLYFDLQREMLENHTPDILGHMDKIKMHNKEFGMFDQGESWYSDLVRSILCLAKEKGVVVEINTKAFQRTGLLYPGPEYFDFIRAEKIPITINSDAHMTKFLTLGFEAVATMLFDKGIDHLYEFIGGEWVPVPFDRSGLKL